MIDKDTFIYETLAAEAFNAPQADTREPKSAEETREWNRAWKLGYDAALNDRGVCMPERMAQQQPTPERTAPTVDWPERDELLSPARVKELLDLHNLTDTDLLKHALEDWARWRKDIVQLSIDSDALWALRKRSRTAPTVEEVEELIFQPWLRAHQTAVVTGYGRAIKDVLALYRSKETTR